VTVDDVPLADALAGGLAVLGAGALVIGQRRASSSDDVDGDALHSSENLPGELVMRPDENDVWRRR